MTNMIKAIIPFHGFYESVHNASFDDKINLHFEGEEQETYDNVNWAEARIAYSKLFVEQFLHISELPEEYEFIKLSSPKEYNFSTDRIYVFLPKSTILQIVDNTDHDILKKYISESVKERDGFIPFEEYTRNWFDTPFTDWDALQIEILLLAYLESNDIDDIDLSIVSELGTNGQIYDIIQNCLHMES